MHSYSLLDDWLANLNVHSSSLLHLFELTGDPSESHTMLFNGDFVDRGSWSTEVVLLLFAFKWLYPKNVFLNRGNHETADMNKVYGFEGETKKKYSELTYKLFEDAFCALPIATVVSASIPPREVERRDTRFPVNPILSPRGVKRFYIVHGGLYSKDGVKLDDIRKIDRIGMRQPGTFGLMSESLWADPQELPGRGPSKRVSVAQHGFACTVIGKCSLTCLSFCRALVWALEATLRVVS